MHKKLDSCTEIYTLAFRILDTCVKKLKYLMRKVEHLGIEILNIWSGFKLKRGIEILNTWSGFKLKRI